MNRINIAKGESLFSDLDLNFVLINFSLDIKKVKMFTLFLAWFLPNTPLKTLLKSFQSSLYYAKSH